MKNLTLRGARYRAVGADDPVLESHPSSPAHRISTPPSANQHSLFPGPMGAVRYRAVQPFPALELNHSFQWVKRRNRRKELESAVLENPSAGNYEELGEIYSEQKNYAPAKECFDKAIPPRSNMPSPFYGRAQCELQLGDYPAAVADL